MKTIGEYLNLIIELGLEYAPKLFLAIIVLAIGWWITNKINHLALKTFDKSKLDDAELKTFLGSILNVGLKILLILSVAGIVGIETTSFVGIIAAMGFAVGLALQGNLSNFASGVLIMFLRPFKIGDEVKIQGSYSFVKEIQIFHTVLKNFDNTETIIPNSIVMSGTIQNMSKPEIRRILTTVRVAFNEDLEKVETVIKEVASSMPGVITEPRIWYSNFDPHFIQLTAVFEANQDGFWTVSHASRKNLIQAFAKHNIKVAYPTGVVLGEYGVIES